MSAIHNKTAKNMLAFPLSEMKTAGQKAKVFNWIDQHWSSQRFVQRIPLKNGESPPPLYPPREPDNDYLDSTDKDPKLQPLPPSHMAQRELTIFNQALQLVNRQFMLNHVSMPQPVKPQKNVRSKQRRVVLQQANERSSPPEYMISRQSSTPSGVLFPMPSRYQTSFVPKKTVQPVALIPVHLLLPAPIIVKCDKPIMDVHRMIKSGELFPMPCGSSEMESPASSPPLIITPPPTIKSPSMVSDSIKNPSSILKHPCYKPVVVTKPSQKTVHFSQNVNVHNKIPPTSSKAAASPISSPPLLNFSPAPVTSLAVQYPPPSILKRPKNAKNAILQVPNALISMQQRRVQQQHNVYFSFSQRRRKTY